MGNQAACGEQIPCFTVCCDEGKGYTQRRASSEHQRRTLAEPGYEIELAVSPLAGLKGVAGYHSSIIIQGEEYFFSPMGIIHSPSIQSHKKNPHMQRLFIGLSRFGGSDLVELFDQHFPPGHYDLLRKNCNSFSDCALYFLCEQRLDPMFRAVERFGKFADDSAGIIQSISGGEYAPNPQAVGFDLEAVIEEIDAERPSFENDIKSVRHGVLDQGTNPFPEESNLSNFNENETGYSCEPLEDNEIRVQPDLIDLDNKSFPRKKNLDLIDLTMMSTVPATEAGTFGGEFITMSPLKNTLGNGDDSTTASPVKYGKISLAAKTVASPTDCCLGSPSTRKPARSAIKESVRSPPKCGAGMAIRESVSKWRKGGPLAANANSGPTDPLGITYNAPVSAWGSPKSVSAKAPFNASQKRNEPKTWNELRSLP